MACKEFWKKEFTKDALTLEHNSRNDFYLSCWQRGTSPLIMFVLRSLTFIAALSIWIISVTMSLDYLPKYLIYFTHWGVVLVLATTGFGAAISAKAFFTKLPDASLGLTWVEKAYWVLSNATTAVAILITIGFWSLLFADSPDPLFLDIATHLMNSVVLLPELWVSAMPRRVLHLLHALAVFLSYGLFSLIYHFAGGRNRFNLPYIYIVLDWRKPGPTLGVVFGLLAMLVLSHLLVVGMTVARDALARKYVHDHSPPDGSQQGQHNWRERNTQAV